jgi:hypothetical protein
MKLPPDPGCQLLRLRSGEKMTKVQCLEILVLFDPVSLVDQLAVHEGNLSDRATEAQAANAR